MKCMLLLTGGGPMVILTSSTYAQDPALLHELELKGINKFISYEIPIEIAAERYGSHFAAVSHDIHETDQLRILDFNGQRAFKLFKFKELGRPTRYEGGEEILYSPDDPH